MKQPFLIFLVIMLGYHPFYGQQPAQKGAAPLTSAIKETKGNVRAVLVGISDYQHNDIPDLQYADKDAEAFAAFLTSNAGGSVPTENIVLLKNSQATMAKFAVALDGLLESCSEGDVAIIFFSGHGDVELKTVRQNGFLLMHDSPATTYIAGAYPLSYLQDVVSTLSEKNKARVILVTDACHAGKLAGSSAQGTQVTNAALATKFAAEVKIMSCQPNELSLEGVQWGGGRGVFSFHLINGLTGLADSNQDEIITLLEIGRYLEDNVPKETSPHPQMPMTVGDRQFQLAKVDALALATLQKGRAVKELAFAQTNTKGLEDQVLGNLDSLTKAKYNSFLSAIESQKLLLPAGTSANDLYVQLIQNEQLKPLHSLMRRNLAAALLDEVQQAINKFLDNDPTEANNWKTNPGRYTLYPSFIQRAIELLGHNHYMYRSLMSKKLYFEGYNMIRNLGNFEVELSRRDSLKKVAKAKYLEAIQYEPEAAYLYYAIGNMYFIDTPLNTDSLVHWCSRAAELSPQWVIPMLEIAFEYRYAQTDFVNAEIWVQRAANVSANSYNVLEQYAWLRSVQGRTDEAIFYCNKMIELRPELYNGYNILAHIHFYMTRDFVESEKYCKASIERNPRWSESFYLLCRNLLETRKVKQAIEKSTEWIESDSIPAWERGYLFTALVPALIRQGNTEAAESWTKKCIDEQLGDFYIHALLKQEIGKLRIKQNRLSEAIELFQDALVTDPTPDPGYSACYAWLAEAYSLQNDMVKAREYFKMSDEYFAGYNDWDSPYKEEAWFLYGNFHLRKGNLPEAAQYFKKSLDRCKKGYWGEYGFALLSAKKGETREALAWLEKSLVNFYPDAESIMAEPLFKKIRKTRGFRELMAKHFSHQ